jgi:hypothetical protein
MMMMMTIFASTQDSKFQYLPQIKTMNIKTARGTQDVHGCERGAGF